MIHIVIKIYKVIQKCIPAHEDSKNMAYLVCSVAKNCIKTTYLLSGETWSKSLSSRLQNYFACKKVPNIQFCTDFKSIDCFVLDLTFLKQVGLL